MVASGRWWPTLRLGPACELALSAAEPEGRPRRALLLLAAALLVGLLLPAPPAAASGVVGTGTKASCTEAALDTALSRGGDVTFNCGAAPVVIAVSSQKVIDSANTTIDGANLVTLTGGNATRLFFVSTGATLTLRNLVVSHGFAKGAHVEGLGCDVRDVHEGGDGGGIYNCGTLILTNSSVQNNSSGDHGGGIYNSRGASMTLAHATLSFNSASSSGGGTYNRGTATLTDSTLFSGNSAARDGGGIWSEATLSINDSIFYGNSAFQGGGISNDGTATLTNTTLSGNSATLGGGIFNLRGTATLTNTTLSGNSAGRGGGGIFAGGTATLTNTTLSGNSAELGGGILNGGTATLTNTTLSSNSARRHGGGIYNVNTATLTNTTLSGNSAELGGGIYAIVLTGFVVFGFTTLKNSIVADSPTGGNCSAVRSDGIGSTGFNLSSDTSCTRYFTQPGDQNNTPAGLGPLADYGGFTLTHLPSPGIAAVDLGTNADCPDTDQRGLARPVGLACDVGAVEVQDPEFAGPLIVRSVLRTDVSFRSGVDPAGRLAAGGEVTSVPAGSLIAVDYVDPGGGVVTDLVGADDNGGFQSSFCPTMVGTWTVQAFWQGDPEHTGAVSDPTTVEVDALPLCAALEPTSIPATAIPAETAQPAAPTATLVPPTRTPTRVTTATPTPAQPTRTPTPAPSMTPVQVPPTAPPTQFIQ